MQEPIESYCRTGTAHFMLRPACADGGGPFIETFAELAADADLEVIEVGDIPDAHLRRDVLAIARTARIDLACAAQFHILEHGWDLGAIDESLRQQAVIALSRHLEHAADLEAESLAVMSGRDPGPALREAACRQLVRSLQELSDRAAEVGIRILLEPFDRDLDRQALIGPTAEAVEIHRRVARSNFGLLLDLSHLPLLGERSIHVVPLARDALQHVYIGNCVLTRSSELYGDRHPPFGCPQGANGVQQLAEFLRVLLDVGFFNTRTRPVMSFMVRPRDGEDPRLVLAGAKRHLRTAWLEV